MNVSRMSDEELVSGCIRKDPKAQRYLFDTFSGRLMGVCMRYCDSREEAEDILQDGLVKIFERIGTFKGNGSLEGWMRRIVVNTALDQFRKNKAFRNSFDISEMEHVAGVTDHVLETMDARDMLKVIKALPTGFRTVFNLYAIEGYHHKEIADMLGITESTSKSQYSRARGQLIKMLRKENEYHTL
ncbi:MAG TPA: RNA polymerase sigma factor [Bacteroidia bacterium]|nr:RNA polymerase sigma factor [Bacteroidia bacterium]